MGAFRSKGWLNPATTSLRLFLYQSCNEQSAGYIRRMAETVADVQRFRISVVVNQLNDWESTAEHKNNIVETARNLLQWLTTDTKTRVSIKIIIRVCEYNEELNNDCPAEYKPNEIYADMAKKGLSDREKEFLRHSSRLRIVSELQSHKAEDQGELIERYHNFRI